MVGAARAAPPGSLCFTPRVNRTARIIHKTLHAPPPPSTRPFPSAPPAERSRLIWRPGVHRETAARLMAFPVEVYLRLFPVLWGCSCLLQKNIFFVIDVPFTTP